MKRELLVAVFVCVALEAGPFEVLFDPSTTHVKFTLGDVLHTVHGEFRLRSGAMRFDPVSGDTSGAIVVDAASGHSGSTARDSRMHKNILESSKYPEITFAPDHLSGAFKPLGASDLQLHGSFSIHGASHEITVPVHVQAQKGQLTISAQFAVPYVKWGMKNPSTLLLRVNDIVEIVVDATARPVTVP